MLKSMSQGLKVRLACGLIVMAILLLDVIPSFYVQLGLTLVTYAIVAYPVLISAVRDLFIRHRMSEQFLMTIATFGALGLKDFPEALAVMVFYLIGEAFEDYAASRSHNEIASLVKLKPSKVRVVNEDGSESILKPRQVKIGTKIRVLAGEAIALDGKLVNASAAVDLSALNGESEPALFEQGQEIPSGGINMGQVIELIVTTDSKNSSITRLINLIEDAAANKSKPEALITRFSVYYTPIVVGCAVLLALVPLVSPNEAFSDWFTRALIFLVVSCPCALVLSVPLSFFGGLGAISKTGVMVKGSIHLENLAKLKTIALDKTGTITQGRFSVKSIHCLDPQGQITHTYRAAPQNAAQPLTPAQAQAQAQAQSTASDSAPNAYLLNTPSTTQGDKAEVDLASLEQQQQILAYLYALERYTTHPIGHAVVNYCQSQGLPEVTATNIHEIAGFGLEGDIQGHHIAVGQVKLVQKLLNLTPSAADEVGTEIYIMKDGQLLGRVILADVVKPTALAMFDELKANGIKTVMITGDKEKVAASIASQCHISSYFAEQLPQDKLAVLQKLKAQDQCVAFVGDGINDAPSLAAADVGIAMGQFGSASAVEAADVVVMNDDLTKIPKTIELAKKTYALAKQNMLLVISVKLLILILGALGFANIWLAILGDVGLCVIAVLNAMRTLTWVKTKKPQLSSNNSNNDNNSDQDGNGSNGGNSSTGNKPNAVPAL